MCACKLRVEPHSQIFYLGSDPRLVTDSMDTESTNISIFSISCVSYFIFLFGVVYNCGVAIVTIVFSA